MSTLYITEYAGIDGTTQAPIEPSIASQTVIISGSSAQSNPFSVGTRLVRLSTDSICSVDISENPTATTNNGRLAANQTEFRSVRTGMIAAVISNT